MSIFSHIIKASRTVGSRRFIHSSSRRAEITHFQMPAMSPTMTEGGIAQWKKKEGESFTAGDVLLEIETDKATIDVEAQDDGIMGKIIKPDGSKNIGVGTIIAILAQEGDDISNLEIPAEKPSSPEASSSVTSSTPPTEPKQPAPSPPPSQPSQPLHIDLTRPIFPSVIRLLEENHVSDPSSIKGTGVRGMLTKGDVLAYLGKASGPNGTFKDNTPTPSVYKSQAVRAGSVGTSPTKAPLDAAGIRQTIVSSLLADSIRSRTPAPSPIKVTMDSIIDDYLPRPKPSAPVPLPNSEGAITKASKPDFLDGLH